MEVKTVARELMHLRHTFSDQNIVIDAVDGRDILHQAVLTFPRISNYFLKWDLNHPSYKTDETLVFIDELVISYTAQQMFDELTSRGYNPILTQHQIKKFCQQHAALLTRRSNNFFFFKKEKNWLMKLGEFFGLSKAKEEYFAAIVYFKLGGLAVDVSRLDMLNVYFGENRHRVIYPAFKVN